MATPTWSISPPPGAGASSSASISSSAASVSFWPSRSKNLTPLYSGGLCEAEMTTPRSSASSATAGVGSTPASTAVPPAEATPRANASSSSSPEARVSRPTKTRPPRDHSVAARPSRSTSSSVMNSPTTPRTPSVPKYRLAKGRSLTGARVPKNRTGATAPGLALRELRRLARLVQAGLLALDDARVARQEALALERDAQLRDRPRRARGRCRGGRRPAWPLGPPPCTRTRRSYVPSTPAVRSGASASLRCVGRGK